MTPKSTVRFQEASHPSAVLSEVSDGVARIYGLRNAEANELLQNVNALRCTW